MDRRDFLKGLAAGGLAAGIARLAQTTCKPRHPVCPVVS
jgi:hypothetical protein